MCSFQIGVSFKFITLVHCFEKMMSKILSFPSFIKEWKVEKGIIAMMP
jgi:hypothetical protein